MMRRPYWLRVCLSVPAEGVRQTGRRHHLAACPALQARQTTAATRGSEPGIRSLGTLGTFGSHSHAVQWRIVDVGCRTASQVWLQSNASLGPRSQSSGWVRVLLMMRLMNTVGFAGSSEFFDASCRTKVDESDFGWFPCWAESAFWSGNLGLSRQESQKRRGGVGLIGQGQPFKEGSSGYLRLPTCLPTSLLDSLLGHHCHRPAFFTRDRWISDQDMSG